MNYYYINREYILTRQKKYNSKNREKIREYNRNYWANTLKYTRNNIMNPKQQTPKNKLNNMIEIKNEITVLFN